MNIVLINGIHGTTQELAPLTSALEESFEVASLNPLGHGKREVPPALSVEAHAADVIAQMNERGLQAAHICGYSFGGYVALYLAKHYPDRVLGITSIATKYLFDEKWTSLTQFLLARLLDPVADQLQQVNRRREMERLHGPAWRDLCRRNLELCTSLPQAAPLSVADLQSIAQPAFIVGFAKDPLVPRQETSELARQLKNGSVLILAGKGHPFSAVPADTIAAEICRRFLR